MMSVTICSQSRTLLRLSEVSPQPIKWLWDWHIPLGHLTLFQGDPGVGKSLVAMDLCARISTGQSFPDGSAGACAGDVVIWNAEDGAKDVVRQRLEAAGADLDRVHVPHDDASAETIGLPSGVDTLDAQLTESRARMVVIDPIVAFLDRRIATHDDKSVRLALGPVSRLAKRHHCAVVVILHLNKESGPRAIYRGGGSIAFQATVRSSWHIAAHPWRPDQAVMAQVKNNYAPLQSSRCFQKLPSDPGPTLRWLDSCELAADQIAGSAIGKTQRPRDRARDLLEDFLAEEPRTSEEVQTFCDRHDLAERTVRRAKRELDVQRVGINVGGRRAVYVLLPGQPLPDEIPTSAIDCDPEVILQQMPNTPSEV
jgi:RecA-family ATPase